MKGRSGGGIERSEGEGRGGMKEREGREGVKEREGEE